MGSRFFPAKAINRWQLFGCALLVTLLSACVTPKEWEQRQQRIVTELRQNPHMMVQPIDAGGISAQVRSGVSFQRESMAPTPELYGVLDNVISALGENRADYRIVVLGHTDNTDPKNPQNTNQTISSTRAALVARYLADNGIDKSLVSSEGKGASQPLVDNETEEGRSVNRRIELLILPISGNRHEMMLPLLQRTSELSPDHPLMNK
ncbi:MAG: OmpA family protein [Betaproteobacteria bacterium]|nr:OmpA family protein [Betaproteobacteria bacterium]